MSRLSPLRLVGIAAPLVVWALHLVIVYALTGVACERGMPAPAWLGLPPFVWWLWAVTAAAFALIAWLWLRARRAHAQASGERAGFASRVATLSAALAALAVAFTAAPVLMLPHCG